MFSLRWVFLLHVYSLGFGSPQTSSLFLSHSLWYLVVSLLLGMEESSKAPKDSQECCSCESGWTMYIASPVDDDSDDDDNDSDDCSPDKAVHKNADHRTHKTVPNDDKDEDSDDSMASDASSGPSHRELPYLSNKGSRHVLGDSRHSVSEGQSKCSSGKKPNKKVEKKANEKRIKGEKEVPGRDANSVASSYGQGEAKVRRNNKTDGK